MAVYAIGDVQGCFAPLQQLLRKISFDPAHDTLWFTGDLVNRGPESLAVLRFVKNLGERAITVLGNHDLHLLAVAAGVDAYKERDTLADILGAPDKEELLDWLRSQRLFHYDPDLKFALVHAGLLPQWNLSDALTLARETELAIRSSEGDFFHRMYGNEPNCWLAELSGVDRHRVVVNAMTRLRYCDREGHMDMQQKGPPGSQPVGLLPWFQIPGRNTRSTRIVFGHWSALGIYQGDNVLALDSGCLWGRTLTAVRLDADPLQFTDIPCRL